MSLKPKVAFSKDFLASYSRLPLGIQKKVREFTEKFQQDPTQPGLNFEHVEGAKDDKVRSARVDLAHRLLVVHPPKGDVYLCVWVDRHDEAYAWVRNKRFEVNPRSGVFQLFDVEEHKETPRAATKVPTKGRTLFSERDDEELLLAGVPLPLLPSVQALRSEADLDALAPHLPEDAAEILYALASGYSLVDALAEVERGAAAKPKVDTQDFVTALAEPASQRLFKIVETERDLEGMLDAPLAQWRIFLHPTQRKVVEMDASGPVRVLGGPGTGKTVVLMHRARHLARQLAGRDDRVLVTTFTRNLALDLGQNLRNLCGPEFARIEVVNLHAWAMHFLRRQGVELKVVPDEEERRKRMDLAVDEIGDAGLARSFFLDEWDRVVLAQEIMDRDAYFKARRTGRGTRLNRLQRHAVWEVFARYREGLERDGLFEWQGVVREARMLLERKQIPLPYRAVCADEVQDFTPSELMLLRALAPRGRNDLFLVGDGHQRIYGQPVVLSRCGIDIRGRSRRLKLNYRTTDRIAKRGIAILRDTTVDDLDGGIDTLKGYTSLRRGVDPEIRTFPTEAGEGEFIIARVRQWIDAGTPAEAICVAARTNEAIRTRYRRLLENAGIACVEINKEPEKDQRRDAVRLATMHRMKGLEFLKVLLAGVHEGLVPLRTLRSGENESDPVATADRQQLERCLLYVACTRARDELVIAGYGRASSFLT